MESLLLKCPKNIVGPLYELVLASQAVSYMSGSSSLASFGDGRQVSDRVKMHRDEKRQNQLVYFGDSQIQKEPDSIVQVRTVLLISDFGSSTR